jgi:hypothetical protein
MRSHLPFKFLFIAITFLFSASAWSQVEVKMTYTNLTNKIKNSKVYSGSGSIPSADPMTGIGGDLIVILPASGFGLGIRYENLGLNFKGNGIVFDANTSRTAALFSWRWWDSLIYFGPIFSYGISHSGGQIKVTENSSINSDLTSTTQSSYSAGVELGGRFLGFRVGAEAGYLDNQWKNLKGTNGSITHLNSLDMSGSYVKFIIGFGL